VESLKISWDYIDLDRPFRYSGRVSGASAGDRPVNDLSDTSNSKPQVNQAIGYVFGWSVLSQATDHCLGLLHERRVEDEVG
jgi:hypothetical protein